MTSVTKEVYNENQIKCELVGKILHQLANSTNFISLLTIKTVYDILYYKANRNYIRDIALYAPDYNISIYMLLGLVFNFVSAKSLDNLLKILLIRLDEDEAAMNDE